MIRRPPRSTQIGSSAASDVYKRQVLHLVNFDDISSCHSIARHIVVGHFNHRYPFFVSFDLFNKEVHPDVIPIEVEFAESETGKHYLKQPENSGANSSRFTQPASGQKITQTDFNKLLPKQQAEFMNKGGTII